VIAGRGQVSAATEDGTVPRRSHISGHPPRVLGAALDEVGARRLVPRPTGSSGERYPEYMMGSVNRYGQAAQQARAGGGVDQGTQWVAGGQLASETQLNSR